MKLIKTLLALPVFVAVIVFVLQNRLQVEVSFWPFDYQAVMPISILSLGLLIVGFVLGSLVTGLSGLRASLEAKRLRGQVAKLSSQIEESQTQAQSPLSCEPTILYKGRYQTVSTLEKPAPRTGFKRWFGKKE